MPGRLGGRRSTKLTSERDSAVRDVQELKANHQLKVDTAVLKERTEAMPRIVEAMDRGIRLGQLQGVGGSATTPLSALLVGPPQETGGPQVLPPLQTVLNRLRTVLPFDK